MLFAHVNNLPVLITIANINSQAIKIIGNFFKNLFLFSKGLWFCT